LGGGISGADSHQNRQSHVQCDGITAYLSNGGTLEEVRQIAGQELPRTTKFSDRSRDDLTLVEMERILI
jgi:hypothetical protein